MVLVPNLIPLARPDFVIAVMNDEVFDARGHAALGTNGIVVGVQNRMLDRHVRAVHDIDPITVSDRRRVDVNIVDRDVRALRRHDAPTTPS